jgi:hypothetical protein
MLTVKKNQKKVILDLIPKKPLKSQNYKKAIEHVFN